MAAATTTAGVAPLVAGTRPYDWPYDGQLDPASLALAAVVGKGEGDGPGDQAVAAVLAAAVEARTRGVAVVWIACSGAELPPRARAAGDFVVESPTANGFLGSNLDLVLRTNGFDKLAFAGWPTEIAVHSTLRRANDLGYECLVLEDLCAPADPALQESSISQILMSGGIFGAAGASSALFEALPTTEGGIHS